MPPDNSRRTNQYIQKRTYTPPNVSGTPNQVNQNTPQDAAANIIRGQIDNILQQSNTAQEASPEQTTQSQSSAQPLRRIQAASTSFEDTSHTNPDSPYDQTHEANRQGVPAEQWKRYHSAWQDYYQQYYERYYIGEVYRMRETIGNYTAATGSDSSQAPRVSDTIENEDVFHDLRADLLRNIRTSATKVRRSRHFIPALAGTFTVLIFWFLALGGNQLVISRVYAYTSPGSQSQANIVVDPNISVPISEEPRLIIPKINVDVPVVYDTNYDHASQMKAMEKGVAWFGIPGAKSVPGQLGNTVLSGHSSNDLFDPGDYKFIFARLDQLNKDDTFYLNYKGKRYVYSITKKEVVMPSDVHKLIYPPEKAVVTLITCVPLGTAQKRLLVTAEQVNHMSDLKPAPDTDQEPDKIDDAAMPGNSSSLLGRVFGD